VSPKHLKAETVEPEETTIARQWLGEHIPMASNTQTAVEELLDVAFSMPVCVISNTQYAVKGKLVISFSQNLLLFYFWSFLII
jgi:hypothetical protein